MPNYLTTLDQAIEFFQRCGEKEAVTIEERLKILSQMEKERLVFEQTDEQVRKRLNGKKVCCIKRKR